MDLWGGVGFHIQTIASALMKWQLASSRASDRNEEVVMLFTICSWELYTIPPSFIVSLVRINSKYSSYPREKKLILVS